MNVTCNDCQTVFRVDPSKVTREGLRARCSVCGGVIPVAASVQWADAFADVPPRVAMPRAASASPAASAAPPDATWGVAASAGAEPAPEPAAVAVPTPAIEAERTTEAAPVAEAPTLTPAATPPETPPEEKLPSAAELVASLINPRLTESAGAVPAAPRASSPSAERPTPSTGRQVTPRRLTPIGGGGPPRTTRPASPAFGAPLSPSRPMVATPASGSGSGARPTPTGEVAVATDGGGTGAGEATTASTTRRPINPFLANDPNQKARRLARALVSDMVAYHPSKREEGLRNGSLKQLFREEIKKSYEEYVEQVGREFAEATSHFQDALNDVLAGGRKIF